MKDSVLRKKENGNLVICRKESSNIALAGGGASQYSTSQRGGKEGGEEGELERRNMGRGRGEGDGETGRWRNSYLAVLPTHGTLYSMHCLLFSVYATHQ